MTHEEQQRKKMKYAKSPGAACGKTNNKLTNMSKEVTHELAFSLETKPSRKLVMEQVEQKQLRKRKARSKGKGTAWYKNYIPKKHVEDIDPIEVGLSSEEKAVEMLEAALDSRFDSMAKETGAEYWPAIPMR